MRTMYAFNAKWSTPDVLLDFGSRHICTSVSGLELPVGCKMSTNFRRSEFIDPRHIRMARGGLGLSVRDLAELAGVNKATIVRLEAGIQPARASTIDAVRSALEHAGATFLAEEDPTAIAVSIKPRT